MAEDREPPPGVDAGVTSPARVWNALLGGEHNYQVDQLAARAAAAALPALPAIARQVRLFQSGAVRRLAGLGVRQFLDIGTGLPADGSVHEIAQAVAPESRVVYVDNDPLVLAHARALLTSSRQGACAYLDEDLRRPARIMERAAETLDLRQPTAVMLIAVLHFIADEEDPWALVDALLQPIEGTAYLVISHLAGDLGPGAQSMTAAYNARSPVSIHARDHDQIARFFEGTEMLSPGLVALGDWPAGAPRDADAGSGHVGVGRRAARRP